MTEWKPIETAPKDGTQILIWGRQDWRVEIEGEPEWQVGAWEAMGFGDYWALCDFAATEIIATHWQPLPDPP